MPSPPTARCRRPAAGTIRGCPAAALLLLALGWLTPAALARGPASLSEAQRRAISRGQERFNSGDVAGGLHILDSLRTAALHQHDEVLFEWTVSAKAALLTWSGGSRAADSLLAPILPRIEARADTALLLSATTWYAKALLDQGRFAAAESVYIKLRRWANRAGNRETEGWAAMGLAYVALQFGRDAEARGGYRAAGRLLREAGNRYGELEARTGLGRTYADLDSACACWTAVTSLAREAGQPRTEATALGNLGNLELVRGDPAAAVDDYQAARRILRSAGDRRAEIGPAINLVRALADLGRRDEARTLLDSLLQVSRAAGFADFEARELELLGHLEAEAGHPRRARQAALDLLALGDRAPLTNRIDAELSLAHLLEAEGKSAEALALLERPEVRALRSRARGVSALDFDHARAELLLRCHRPRDAALVAEAEVQQTPSLRGSRIAVIAWTTAVRARLALGDLPGARRNLRAAIDEWERCRDRPTDEEWRERRTDSEQLATTAIRTLTVLHDGEAPRDQTAAAFELAQRFKARGLAERFRRVHEGAPEEQSVSLDRVQRGLMRPGELLLDAYAGADTSYLFAVTQDECRLVALPGEEELGQRIRVLRGFLSTASAAGADRAAAYEAVATQAGPALLGAAAEMAARAKQIVLASDGPLHLLPLDVLCPRAAPGIGPVVALVPSVAQWSRLRREERPPDARADGGLVLVGAANREGERLTGARREAADLERRFAGVRVIQPPPDPAATASLLRSADLLHFAAHAEWNEQYPWRSGILLSSRGRPRGSVFLPAERIVTTPLAARLVVISACESARGPVIRGEGVLGLSTAFLAGGAHSIVATLWPVDDQATAAFMSRFYDGLARKSTVGQALRDAKDGMARSARYQDPCYWAGFVLLGEPEERLSLRPRPIGQRLSWEAVGGTIVLIALGFAARRRWRRPRPKSPVTDASGSRPT